MNNLKNQFDISNMKQLKNWGTDGAVSALCTGENKVYIKHFYGTPKIRFGKVNLFFWLVSSLVFE